MKMLYDWVRTGFRNATRSGILEGASDAANILSGGLVVLDDKLVLEAKTTVVAAKSKTRKK